MSQDDQSGLESEGGATAKQDPVGEVAQSQGTVRGGREMND